MNPLENRHMAMQQRDINAPLRRWHAWSAALLGTFLLLHLGNHLLVAQGPAAHIDAMTKLRLIYRNPIVELALLTAVTFQVASGAVMLWRGRKQRPDLASRLQAWTGFGLALFLANHVAAVLLGRSVFGLDTNIHFAAAGFQVDGWRFFFIPYYFLGVALLFAHLACALWWRSRSAVRWLAPPLLGVGGAALAAWLVALLARMPPVPAAYLAVYP